MYSSCQNEDEEEEEEKGEEKEHKIRYNNHSLPLTRHQAITIYTPSIQCNDSDSLRQTQCKKNNNDNEKNIYKKRE